MAVGDGLPSLVSTLADDLVGSSKAEDSLALVGEVILATLDRRAVEHLNNNLVALAHLHAGEVGRSLNESRNLHAHGSDAVRCSINGINNAACGVGVDNGLGHINAVASDFHLGLGALVLILNIGNEGVENHAQLLLILGLDTHNNGSGMRDSVVQVTSVDACEHIVHLVANVPEQAAAELGSGGIAQVDVGTTVTAMEVLKLDLEVNAILGGSLRLVVELEDAHQTTGAAHSDDAIFLLVEVEQIVAHEHVGLNIAGTSESCLLVNGSKRLERSTLQRRLDYCCQCYCQTHAIVGTKGGVVGAHPLAVDNGLDGVGVEVMGRTGSFLGYHVHVALQHNALAILIARSCWPEDCHVAGFVNLVFKIVLLGKINEPCADFV